MSDTEATGRDSLVDIVDLHVDFGTRSQPLPAVEGVDLSIGSAEIVGLVGESGSGKTLTALALLDLVDFPGRVVAKRMAFAGRDLVSMPASDRRTLAGRDIGMIFQDPHASLDPCYTVGYQLDEAIRLHGNAHERANAGVRRERALALLRDVDVPDPSVRLRAYPHQLSGGMAQRVMIAIAIAGRPRLLVADEPTTALDVTVQAQVLALLTRLRTELRMAILLITHDLALVAEVADRVVVMYAGQIVETGSVPALFDAPRHPYTHALLEAVAIDEHERLPTIAGAVPAPNERPRGCVFAPRCTRAAQRCEDERPAWVRTGQGGVRCHFPIARQ